MPFRQEILDIVLSELANSSTNAVGTDRFVDNWYYIFDCRLVHLEKGEDKSHT